jgi:opacity protein-like surface antigen
MKKLLIGVSALALGLAAASGAWANPKNTFSNFNHTVVVSTAATGWGNATSESFNVNKEAVSVQTMKGVAIGATLDVDLVPILAGNAVVGTINENAGIAQGQANSGTTTVQQQGVALSAVGSVTIH